MRYRVARWLVCLWFVVGAAHSEEVTVAVAANFLAPMQQLVALFERQSEYRVRLASGSTGTLYAQIRHGAPFHLFFAADRARPQLLVANGLASANYQFTYAYGRLALWAPGLSDNDIRQLQHDARYLRSLRFSRLALANPKIAPYGAAAEDVLRHFETGQPLVTQRILGQSVAQTYQHIASGAVPVGFVALSQIVRSQPTNCYWLVPTSLHRAIVQDALLLPLGESLASAQAFYRFIQTPQARRLIVASGYSLPEHSAAAKSLKPGL